MNSCFAIRKVIFISILLLYYIYSAGQENQTQSAMKVYLIPGQGADYRLFKNLKLDSVFQPIHLDFFTPKRGTTMKQYAHQLAESIDTTEKFALLGVSMGGMICSEMTEFLNPEKVIIISSAKSRNEMPGRYRIMKHLPFYEIIPNGVIKVGSYLAQPLVEPDRKKDKETFQAMLRDKDPKFLKRSIRMIIRWDKEAEPETITHIHGNNDHTLPLKKVNADIVIEGGSHMMVLTRGEEISPLVNEILLGE